MKRRQHGITLIELMIVVVIVGILAAVAYPSYREQVRRSNRTEAKVALERTAQALEKCFTRYMSYTDDNCAASGQFDAGASFNTEDGHYTVTGNFPTATTYVLTATPQGGQASDAKCMNFTLTEAGVRDVSGTQPPAQCW